MEKQIGAILLIAGTCIGSGTIALPMVLAKLGIIPSILLMISMWFLIYYTSLVNLEINLQSGKGRSLGNLGKHFSGKISSLTGTISLKLLSYSLLAVFIYGGSSIIQKLFGTKYDFRHIASIYSLCAIIILLFPLKLIDYINRILFIGLLSIFGILMIGLVSMIDSNDLPLFAERYNDISAWYAIIPIIFTSFGFQVIFHTLTNYCNKDKVTLKTAFFWGSIIPTIIYIIWTCSVLIVIHQENPSFYYHMVSHDIEVGEMVSELSKLAKWPLLQLMIWWISFLAIMTSVLGVGIGLTDSIKTSIKNKIPNDFFSNLTSVLITIIPAYIIAILVPNAFIAVLGFAGMILVIIAILLPIYLLHKANIKIFNYPELKKKYLLNISIISGIIIVLCEIMHMVI